MDGDSIHEMISFAVGMEGGVEADFSSNSSYAMPCIEAPLASHSRFLANNETLDSTFGSVFPLAPSASGTMRKSSLPLLAPPVLALLDSRPISAPSDFISSLREEDLGRLHTAIRSCAASVQPFPARKKKT